ncbi:MAG TPA: ArsR family transcriptional regulator [Candidatus Thermoplasmatota archaeon]|nr:ArsR family transcriptional regulator [Candidatus Thermoplasmatota archaeon]
MAGREDPVSTRQRVYASVRRYPGIHVRGLERELRISSALAQYHVRKLDEEGFIEGREQGGYVRYYPTSKGKAARVTERDIPLVGVLREQVPLHVALLLLDRGPLTHADLARELGVAKSTTSYHLAKLAEAGIVVREPGTPRLTLAERDRIYRLLLAYQPTPDFLDAFADLWSDLYG